jgi:hypothetical protein
VNEEKGMEEKKRPITEEQVKDKVEAKANIRRSPFLTSTSTSTSTSTFIPLDLDYF